MDYHGTDGNDILDQSKLGLPDWALIFGGKGDDAITIGVGSANGEAGNDTITGKSPASTVVYWSPMGVVVNLATGIAQDGYGTIDKLINIHTVQGTAFDDQFIGSAANDEFWGLNGNDTFIGGGSDDTVVFWDTKYSDSVVTYDATTDTFKVSATSVSGGHGLSTLVGIATLSFRAPSYEFALTKYDLGAFPKTYVSNVIKTTEAFAASVKTGDFNGDGFSDLLIVQQIGSGTREVQDLIYLGNGTGKFIDGTTSVFGTGAGISNPGGGRTLVADFNKDGISDIFQLGFGDDAPPFPGGKNQLFLSSTAGKIVDSSSSLQQSIQLNHGGSVGDVNGDGYLDVLVNSLKDGNFLQVNDGTGHFVDRTDLLPHQRMGASQQLLTNTYSGIIDLNGDHRDDIILGKWDGGSSTPTTQVLLNDGTGNFTKFAPIDIPSSGVYKEIVLDVKPIDLNGDSLPDLLLNVTSGGDANTVTGVVSDTYYRTPYIQFLVNDGNGKFHDETLIRLPQQLVGNSHWNLYVEVVDFNRDGHPDILATSAGVVSSVMYLNRGDGTFQEYWKSSSGGRTVPEDVNNDGLLDLVTYKEGGSPTISVNQNSLANGHIYKANWGGEALFGSSGNDFFSTRNGNNTLDGGAGVDTASYGGSSGSYSAKLGSNDRLKVVGEGVSDTLAGIERLQFADKKLAFDLRPTEHGGQALEFIGLMAPALVNTPSVVGLILSLLDQGTSLHDVCQLALDVGLVNSTAGSSSNAALAAMAYKNLIGFNADASTVDMLVGYMDGRSANYSQADFMTFVAGLEVNQTHIGLVGLQQTGIAYV